MPPARWPLLTLFLFSVILQSLDRSLLSTLQLSIMEEFRLSHEAYGRVVAAYSIPYGLAAPLMGILIDRFGFMRVSSLAVAVWSFASVATGWAGSLAGLMGCRFVLGAAEAAGLPATGKVYSEYLSRRERTLGTALNQVLLTFGSVGAVWMAGRLRPLYGWRFTFFLAGGIGLVWVVVWFFYARKRVAAVPAVVRDGPTVRQLLREPKLWALLAANVLTMPLYTLWANWTTAYLAVSFRLSEAEANLSFAGWPPMFATAGALLGGWLTRVFSSTEEAVQSVRFRLSLVGALGVLITLVVPMAATPAAAAVGIGMSFFFTLWISVNIYAMATDMFGENHAGFVYSMLTSVYGLMAAVVSTQLGKLIDLYGFAPACYIGALLPGFGLLLLRLAKCHR